MDSNQDEVVEDSNSINRINKDIKDPKINKGEETTFKVTEIKIFNANNKNNT